MNENVLGLKEGRRSKDEYGKKEREREEAPATTAKREERQSSIALYIYRHTRCMYVCMYDQKNCTTSLQGMIYE